MKSKGAAAGAGRKTNGSGMWGELARLVVVDTSPPYAGAPGIPSYLSLCTPSLCLLILISECVQDSDSVRSAWEDRGHV